MVVSRTPGSLPPGRPRGNPPSGFGDGAARRDRLRDIQEVMNSLRRPVEAPDLTGSILARVEQERPFVDPRTQRLVWVSRAGFAASVAIVALGIALMHRAAPGLLRLASRPQPLSDVVSTAETEVTAGLQSIRSTIAAAASRPDAAGRTPLRYVSVRVDAPGPAWPGERAAGLAEMEPQARVSRVPLVMMPAPRVLAAESRPLVGSWMSPLSTSPAPMGSVIIVQGKPAAGEGEPEPASEMPGRERVVLDRLGAGTGGLDPVEPGASR